MNTQSPAHSPALEVHDLARTYGEGAGAVAALAGVDLAFPSGSFTAVMGPSGSGKSTFLTCAAGLERPTEGRVVIAGEDITHWSEEDRTRFRRERIGFVFQGFHLMPYLTAEQNVGLPLRLAGHRIDRKRVRGAARAGRARRPGRAAALGALRRPAAARRDRPGAGHRPRGRPGRRADRRPRLRRPRTRCWPCCGPASTTCIRPSSWSPTTRSRRRTPTPWSSSSTDGSRAAWTGPPPTRSPDRWRTSTSWWQGWRHDPPGLRLAAAPRHGLARDVRDRAARHRADGLVRDPGRDRHRPRLGHRPGHPLHHGRRRRRVGRPDRALRRGLHGRHHRHPARGRDRPAAHHRRHPTAGAAAGPGRDPARGGRGRHHRCGRRHLRWPAPARHAPQRRRGRRLGAVRRRRRSRGRRDPGRAGQRARLRACGPPRDPRAGDHRAQRGPLGVPSGCAGGGSPRRCCWSATPWPWASSRSP